MRTGPCWVPSRRSCRDDSERAGSLPQRPCCDGTGAELPAIGLNHAGRLAGPAPLRICVVSSSRWLPATPRGATAASPATSSASVTALGASTVWRILKQHRLDPAPLRSSVSWTQFLRSQAAVACDFRTVDNRPAAAAVTCCSSLTSPTARCSAAVPPPSRRAPGPPKAHATSLCVIPTGSPTPEPLFLTAPASSPATSTRSSEAKVSRSCAPRFASQWPTRSRERRIGTPRRELLDRTIIWKRHQLERLVVDYIDHYNTHRPHRSPEQRPPRHTTPDNNTTDHPLPRRLGPNAPLRRPHQRIQTRRLTNHDRVSGTHRHWTSTAAASTTRPAPRSPWSASAPSGPTRRSPSATT